MSLLGPRGWVTLGLRGDESSNAGGGRAICWWHPPVAARDGVTGELIAHAETRSIHLAVTYARVDASPSMLSVNTSPMADTSAASAIGNRE